MCLPLNWTGRDEEFYIHNANIREGGVFDGWGRKVMEFPDDGHPDMCNAVLDITGIAGMKSGCIFVAHAALKQSI